MQITTVLAMSVLRAAVHGDILELSVLIEQSVRVQQRETYTPAQIELALAHVYGVDTALIDDGTYYAVQNGAEIVACGGWSKRAKLYGGDRLGPRSEVFLDPDRDAAKIRAFFVRPGYLRRGLATVLLERCEREAAAAGFGRMELGSTLSGVAFYAARGYVEVEHAAVPLPLGEFLPVVRMERMFS